jgi:hypothetical protein
MIGGRNLFIQPIRRIRREDIVFMLSVSKIYPILHFEDICFFSVWIWDVLGCTDTDYVG